MGRNTDRFPLTPTQLAFWTGQQLNPGVPCYNNAFALTIHGSVDPGTFDRAFQALVAGTDALRTVFGESGGPPWQRVLPEMEVHLEHRSVAGATPAALRAELRERAARPFDLERRTFDSALFEIGPRRAVWYLNLHHLIADGASFARIVELMGDLYLESRDDSPAPRGPSVPSIPGQREYLASLEARAGGARQERLRARWREEARRAPEPLDFFGRSRAERTREERRHSLRLERGDVGRLQALGDSVPGGPPGGHFSLFSALAAGLFAYLHRVTASREPSVGMTFGQRATRLERETVGVVQQTVPVRVELQGDETVEELLRRTKAAAWGAMRAAYGAAGALEMPTSHDVILNYPAVTIAEFAGHPVEAEWLHTGFGDGGRMLFLQACDFGGTGDLSLDFDLNAGVFDEAVGGRVVEQLATLLDALPEDPGRGVSRLPVLADRERQRVVGEFNRTGRPYPDDATLGSLFRAQARRSPDAVAVEHGETTLTYRELEIRAGRMAAVLRERGVGPGVPVAVCAGRTVELMVALLAIFEAGGAYVPLDPSYPTDRLAFMLKDSGAAVLVTEEGQLSRLPRPRPPVLLLYGDGAVGSGGGEALPPDGPPDRPPGPSDLAYVVYTSGSTGRPKGVAMPQRSIANLVQWQMREGTRLESPRTLQFTPLSFDVSLQETFATWCSGGTLVLMEEATRRDPEATLRLLVEARVEQLYIIYTPLQQLAEAADRTGLVPETLREVITAGEQVQITPQLVRLFQRLPTCTLSNQYGPSETHIVTAYTLPDEPSTWPALPSIGTPVANTTAYVLDRHREPLPLGVTGELYIGGDQVADGYLGRPDLTAERFLPDPFEPARPGARLYRTGDLARFLEDGRIDFLGRADTQVKLRGYRIEPGEIEAVLRWHPEVAEAAVVVREDEPGDRRLVGYAVPQAGKGEAGLSGRLRSFLTEKLPPYMVPSFVETIAEIPRTPNGKFDRRALPPPSGARPEAAGDFARPAGRAERALAEVWQDVLGIDEVGRHDDFFRLGGHSLLLVEVHDRVRGIFDREVAITDLFRFTTLADQADFLAGGKEETHETGEEEARAAVRERARRQREGLARLRPERPQGDREG